MAMLIGVEEGEVEALRPREREDFLGKFPEQSTLGSIGEHQHDIDVARPQLDKVTGVCNPC